MKINMTMIACGIRILLILATLSSVSTLAADGPVKVFVLSGQSNMTGRGTLGDLNLPPDDQPATLVRFIKQPENIEKLKFLHEGPNKTETGWTIRDDVFITLGTWPHLKPGEEGFNAYNKHGGLGPFYGGRGSRGFGPELAIGHLLGDHYEEPVLLIKVAFGGNSLAGNFRPPSSGGELGDKYPLVVEAVEEAIKHLPEIVPGYQTEQGYELVGLLWNQGLSDMNAAASQEYETNLVNLIKDLRNDLQAPDMKAVVAVTGNWGRDLKGLLAAEVSQVQKDEMVTALRKVVQAQQDVSQRPEFQGNVATAETRDFWRSRDKFGGRGTDTHWAANGESYWLIGDSMGREMLKLLQADDSSTETTTETTTGTKTTQTEWQPQQPVVDLWSKKRDEFNFTESHVPEYRLPDPLAPVDGNPITTPEDWTKTARPALLQSFRENVYGVRPASDYQIEYQEISRKENVFGVGATARQIRATITARNQSQSFDFVIVIPKSETPVPVVVLINNRSLIPLDEVAAEFDPFGPVEKMVRRGFATASFHTSDVDPDKRDGYESGIRALLDDPHANPQTRWGSLSAWGWAASRVLDFAVQQSGIDPERTAVAGHSRAGKTALWAAAEDERFRIAFSNNSGCGGAALSRRAFGETIARINRNFPHWFCDQFKSYGDRENELPIDQHQLIALMAPRAVYVASADEDLWADPRGEYASLVAAGPVFELFGLKHITDPQLPPLDTPRHLGSTGYHIRTGVHNLTEQDWGHFLNFADGVFDR